MWVVKLATWHTAIRDGFITLLPLTFIGVTAIVFGQPMLAILPGTWAEFWISYAIPQADLILKVSLGCMGLAASNVMAVNGYRLAKKDMTSVVPVSHSVGVISAVVYLILVVPSAGPSFHMLGYQNIFQGLVAAVYTVELILAIESLVSPRETGLKGMNAFNSLSQSTRLAWIGFIAVLIEVVVLWLIDHIFRNHMGALRVWAWNLFKDTAISAYVLNWLLVAVNQLVWLTGINGGQFIHYVRQFVDLPIASENILWSDIAATPMFLNAFVHMGGGGSTWGLIIVILIYGKDPEIRRLAYVSIVPALLNVNELLLFGVPLVLSKFMMPPLLLAPMAIAVWATACVYVGMPLDGRPVSWTTPVLLSGYMMSNSFWGIFVQAVGIVISFMIYRPYFLRLEAERHTNVKSMIRETVELASSPGIRDVALSRRTDIHGDVARRILDDFSRDIDANRLNLVYQPQYNHLNKLIGVEALLRWNHPLIGFVRPDAVVSLSEETDLIHRLGYWVVQKACADARDWQRAGMSGVKLSINVSPIQFTDIDWFDRVHGIVASFGLDANTVDFEITEGRPLDTGLYTELNLRRLEGAGYLVSMDDFGMGATSLLYMQRFKMHAIKLDKCLTQDVHLKPVNQEIISAVKRIAQSQHVVVVAEYVESVEQRDCLLTLGCDVFQGWLYSKPVPSEDIPFLHGEKMF